MLGRLLCCGSLARGYILCKIHGWDVGKMGEIQFCEDAVEGCAGAAGGGQGEPWCFADYGGWCTGWMVIRRGIGRDA